MKGKIEVRSYFVFATGMRGKNCGGPVRTLAFAARATPGWARCGDRAMGVGGWGSVG